MTPQLHDPLDAYHRRTRRRGVVSPWYWLFHDIAMVPAAVVYFGMRIAGRDRVPKRGPLVVVSNHRSFLDPFVVGLVSRREFHFVAKRELFENRSVAARLISSLGAFPLRRGEADEESLETARTLLERGKALLMFPEGTRVREGPIGEPKRGAARLALETGATVVPVAVRGTENARRGWLIRPCRVRIRCGEAIECPRVEDPTPEQVEDLTRRSWDAVAALWEELGGEPRERAAEPAPIPVAAAPARD